MDGHVVAMPLPTARAQSAEHAATSLRAASGAPNPIRRPAIGRVPAPAFALVPAHPDEALLHRHALLATVRVSGATADLEERARDAVLAGLEQRGLRAAVLAAGRPADPATASRGPRLSLADLERAGGPLCDVLLVAGCDGVPLPSVHVRPAGADERCAIYEVHAGDAPERVSVRCGCDLARHAGALVDWILAL